MEKLKQNLPEIKTSSTRKICTCLIEDIYGEWFAGESSSTLMIGGENHHAKYLAKQAQALYYQQVSPSEGTSNVELNGLRYGVFTTPQNTIQKAWILSEAKLSIQVFLVIDKGSVPEWGEDNHLYSTYTGTPYQEDSLRRWANDRWNTPLDASLETIARDIRQGGWLLYEGIWPAN